ncbi:ABC transporter permease [Nocardioides sp.]|jgi:ABC-type transport system involved in multi-copper enzyme maturation permease subunit|uniref:ABC transporter permease n=1 Tax=Nocardioides sp. TaxID=35761 RepID=UPI002F403C1B
MTATTALHADQVTTGRRTEFKPIPLSRVVRVELRKMFDTRSGFWLIASIAITGLIATIATVGFAPDKYLTYYNFAKAVGYPITVILPMVALLSITSEWSQRSGLTTFTYVPSRRRVVWAKTLSAVIVAVASMLFAFAVGAVGNVVGSTIAGTPTVWDLSLGHALTIVLGNLISLSIGTMLGMLLRSSAGGLVMYFVLVLLVPNLSGLLATSQDWYKDLQPWVDLPYAQTYLFEGMQTGAQWAHVATTVGLWIVLPGIFGLRRVMRSEVK